MRFITVMATQSSVEGSMLYAWRLNAEQIISIRDLGSYKVCLEDGREFVSPIVEIKLPGQTFYASGVADELLARMR